MSKKNKVVIDKPVTVKLIKSWAGFPVGKTLDCGPKRAKKLVTAKIAVVVAEIKTVDEVEE